MKQYLLSKLNKNLNYILRQSNIFINSLVIDLKIPIDDTNEYINMKILIKFINFTLNNLDDFDLSLSIKNFQIEIISPNNKMLLKIDLSNINFTSNELTNFSLSIASDLLIYFSLFDIKKVITLINKIKTIKAFNQKNDDMKNIQKKKHFNISFSIDIPNINFFIIKSNLPLLLLLITPTKITFPFPDETKIEIKFTLKHLCHRTYNVISLFSVIIKTNNSKIDVNVSPIQTTFSLFLLNEILIPEVADDFHSELENKYKKIFFINDVEKEIKLTMIKKDSKETNMIILNDQLPYEINEEEYEKNIKVEINLKLYHFSIDSLYQPIFLDQNIIVKFFTENGINEIHFSSPYLIKNKLSYDIEVCFNDQDIIKIEGKNEKYIPYEWNYNLTKGIKFNTFVNNQNFVNLDLKNPKPIKIIVDEKYRLNQNHAEYYATYYLYFDVNQSICSIVFIPFISIRNYLPNKLNLNIDRIATLNLEPEKIFDISFVANFSSNLVFIFNFDEYLSGCGASVNKKIENFVEKVELKKSSRKIGEIIFQCQKVKVMNTAKYYVSIYCPLILENESTIPLSLNVQNDEFYEFINGKIYHIAQKDKQGLIHLPLCYKNLTTTVSSNFRFIGQFSEAIALSYLMVDEIKLLLSIVKRKGAYDQISIIKIQSYFKVYSDINESIIFAASDNKNKLYKNRCNKGENSILCSTIQGEFYVYINGYQKCCNFNMFRLGSYVIRLVKIDNENEYILIHLNVKKEDNGYCCYVSYPKSSTTITIKNNLPNKNIYVNQQSFKNFESHPQIFHPNEKLIFAKEQPFIPIELENKYNLNVSIGNDNKQYLISFEESCQLKRIDDSNYFYDVEKIDRYNKNIIIYEKSESHNIIENDKNTTDQLSKIDFSLIIADIQISYIDERMQELFLLEIQNISLNVDETIKFTVGGFALNDMYSASLSPVVIHGINSPLFFLGIKSDYPLKTLIFDVISIGLSSLQVYIDPAFIIDLISVFINIGKYLSMINLKNDFLKNIFSVNELYLGNIAIVITPRCLPHRKCRCNQVESNISIPIVKEIKICFKELKYKNIEAPIIDFLKTIPDNYKNQITLKNGLFTLISSFTQILEDPKNFDDFLNNMIKIYDDDVLKFPRRLPRSFPKGQILDIPTSLNNVNYPDVYTKIQYALQKSTGCKYREERLLEFYEGPNDMYLCNKLALFDHLVVLFGSKEFYEIDFNDIINIKCSYRLITFSYSNQKVSFLCKTEDEAKSIHNKVNSFILKSKIIKQLTNSS